MKKNKNIQSNDVSNKTNKNINDCSKNCNVSNKSNDKMNSNIGFANKSKSFELDENNEHSFELR